MEMITINITNEYQPWLPALPAISAIITGPPTFFVETEPVTIFPIPPKIRALRSYVFVTPKTTDSPSVCHRLVQHQGKV